jgi:hypothetical protein
MPISSVLSEQHCKATPLVSLFKTCLSKEKLCIFITCKYITCLEIFLRKHMNYYFSNVELILDQYKPRFNSLCRYAFSSFGVTTHGAADGQMATQSLPQCSHLVHFVQRIHKKLDCRCGTQMLLLLAASFHFASQQFNYSELVPVPPLPPLSVFCIITVSPTSRRHEPVRNSAAQCKHAGLNATWISANWVPKFVCPLCLLWSCFSKRN